MASRKDKTKSSQFRAVLRLQSDFNVLSQNDTKKSLPDFLHDHFTMGEPYQLGDDCVVAFKTRQDMPFFALSDIHTIAELNNVVGDIQSHIGQYRDALVYYPQEGFSLKPVTQGGDKQTHFIIGQDIEKNGNFIPFLQDDLSRMFDVAEVMSTSVLQAKRMKSIDVENISRRYKMSLEPVPTTLVIQQDILNHEGHIIQSRDVVSLSDNGGKAEWYATDPFDYNRPSTQKKSCKRPDGRGLGTVPSKTKITRGYCLT